MIRASSPRTPRRRCRPRRSSRCLVPTIRATSRTGTRDPYPSPPEPRMKPTRDRPPPPVRIVHLGLGNFFRAHQAYYTAAAPDAGEWGIAAFTGRSPRLADDLTAQQGL